MSTNQLRTPCVKPDSESDVTKAPAEVVQEGSKNEVSSPTLDESNPSSHLSAYPEGGLVAWTNVAGAFLLQVCTFGYTTSFGVYEDYYTRVYLTNIPSSTISWIGSINSFIIVAAGIFVGRLYDRGYFYYLIYGGSLLLAFSLFMHSLAQQGSFYQILLSQGIAAGIGGGMLYIPSIAVISQYFHARRALAMTVVAAGSSFGAVIHPLMLNNTLPQLGFATAARANAGLIAGLLLIACPMMRLRFPPPVDKGGMDMWHSAKKFARDPPYVFGVLGISTFIVAFYFPLFYIQLDSLKHGLSAEFSFYALVMLNGCSVVGRLASGFLAGWWGVANVITLSTFICVVFVFGMIGLGSVASVIVIAIIYGFFAGSYVALLGPFFSSMADDMSEIGARLGIAFFFCGIGSLISGPINGALLTNDYIWWRPAVFSGIVGLIGMSSYATSAILLHRKRLSSLRDSAPPIEKA